ncbi:MAG: prenyltransferase/squalene oxidase repeat-containing protein, partial [Planctomycetota bacterium]|jgi:hypothetical protein
VIDNAPLSSAMRPEREKPFKERDRGIFESPVHIEHPEEVPNPILLHEPAELDDHNETDNNMDDNSARGSEEAFSDIPLGETGLVAVLGVGPGEPCGSFGYRDRGGRKRAVAHFGGSRLTETAVERALAWLARHQEEDGRWDAARWEASMKTDAGVTGLALLAYLGAGYTEKSRKYGEVVRKATAWITKQQADDGAIGRDMEGTEPNGVGYHHAICGLALAEAYGMAGNRATGAAAQKALDYSVKVHQKPGSGWRYKPGTEADLSVTGWFVMQVKSAKVAGLNVPGTAMQGAMAFTDSAGDQYGRCRYKADWLTPNSTMTSVGMLVRLYGGCRPGDPKVSGGANYLLKDLPVWGENGNGVNFYYWYYGAMTDALVPNQRDDGPKDGSAEDVHGSWDPVGAWCTRGGRAYSTAVGALCLEVYYRYLPIYSK